MNARAFVHRYDPRGFTLVETMFFMILFPILMLAMYAVLNLSNVIFQTNAVYAALNMNAMQTVRYISREVGETSPNALPARLVITTDGGGNSVVRFQIPVDWDNDGDAVTSATNPAAEWGIYDTAFEGRDGRLGGWARYSVTNNQLIREVLDSGLAVVAAETRVIANDVLTFTATQTSSNLRLTVTLRGTDSIGQAGDDRQIQTAFTTNTILRNAVN